METQSAVTLIRLTPVIVARVFQLTEVYGTWRPIWKWSSYRIAVGSVMLGLVTTVNVMVNNS
jgi:hypothetical protein